MKKISLIFACFLISVFYVFSQESNITKVFILAGQSNMEGAADAVKLSSIDLEDLKRAQKTLNIICFNTRQLIGNGLVFPAGPLRERLSSLERAQIVIINGEKNKIFEEKILNISKNIKIFYSEYLPINIEQFKNKKLFAFAGIGNPNNFFDLLSKYNLDVQKKISFPDHYEFKKKEIEQITEDAVNNNLVLITTEKDFYRVKDYGFKDLRYLKVDLKIEEKNKFITEVLKHL